MSIMDIAIFVAQRRTETIDRRKSRRFDRVHGHGGS